MPKLSPQTVTMLDGDVRVFKRDRSRSWQVTFKIDGRWVRLSTKCKQLNAAKARARELYVEYQVRLKNGLPVISKRFADVAAVTIAGMDKQLQAGAGKKSFRDYKIVLQKYFIPYFGDRFITSITYADLQQFAKWREHKMGHEPRASTLNTHNSALNRVFDEAVVRGYMNRAHVPILINKGRDSERRPDFRREEYRKMIAILPTWIDKGRDGKSRDMRHLLRDYILILANTGIRHGTEAQNLRWKHIHLFKEDGLTYLEMHVNGKTGPRDLMCRIGVVNYLKRIQSRSPDIANVTFEELLKSQLDKPVFRLPDGTVTKNLRQTFRLLMDDTGLLKCPRTGQSRTLYSFRHTYATFALLNDGMDVHTLAIQMGTSIQMIERHYSHLTPRLRKDMLTGKRHDLAPDEFRRKYNIQSHAVTGEELVRTDTDAVIEPDLPEEPVIELGLDKTVPEHDTASAEPADTTKRTPAERAFDLFDAGKLGEAGLLAAVGVSRDDYALSETITHRALDAVEQGRLSEAGLVKLLG